MKHKTQDERTGFREEVDGYNKRDSGEWKFFSGFISIYLLIVGKDYFLEKSLIQMGELHMKKFKVTTWIILLFQMDFALSLLCIVYILFVLHIICILFHI